MPYLTDVAKQVTKMNKLVRLQFNYCFRKFIACLLKNKMLLSKLTILYFKDKLKIKKICFLRSVFEHKPLIKI